MNQKQLVANLLEKAKRYASYAQRVGDRQTVKSILALTAELRARARALAHPDEANIRNRAREIWEENGKPAGRDLEFWLRAEREVRDAEAFAKQVDDDV
jgi:Zn-dependent oligopeptidase